MATTARDRRRQADRRRHNVSAAARKREAIITVRGQRAKKRPNLVLLAGVPVLAIVLAVGVSVAFAARNSGPSPNVEQALVKATGTITSNKYGTVFAPLARAESEVAAGPGRFRVVPEARTPNEVSIAEAQGGSQFVLIGADNGFCLGVALHGLERDDAPTVANVPIAPGLTVARWNMPANGCSANGVPARMRWVPSFSEVN